MGKLGILAGLVLGMVSGAVAQGATPECAFPEDIRVLGGGENWVVTDDLFTIDEEVFISDWTKKQILEGLRLHFEEPEMTFEQVFPRVGFLDRSLVVESRTGKSVYYYEFWDADRPMGFVVDVKTGKVLALYRNGHRASCY